MNDRIKLGNATVTRVVEWEFDVGTGLFVDTPPQAWQDEADLLVPTFYDPATGRWRVVMQSWVIDVDGLTVVVDTGVGNDRERPHMPPLSGLGTDFLGALSRAGVDADEVDVVVNTHLHTDHVGWNTTLVDGEWVPTFPNARYLMPEAGLPLLRPRRPGRLGRGRESCSATAFFPSPTRCSCGQTTSRSASRCGCAPPPATPPARRCCGSTPGGPRSSSAI